MGERVYFWGSYRFQDAYFRPSRVIVHNYENGSPNGKGPHRSIAWQLFTMCSMVVSIDGHHTLSQRRLFIDTTLQWQTWARFRVSFCIEEGIIILLARSTMFPKTDSSFLTIFYGNSNSSVVLLSKVMHLRSLTSASSFSDDLSMLTRVIALRTAWYAL